MSTLLIELHGNPTFNRTIWPAHLLVFDDLLIYKKRSWFVIREITISYNQIARVTLVKSVLFAHLEIETTGADNVKLRYLSKGKASYAKTIIDQKIYRSHAKHAAAPEADNAKVSTFEKSLNRLKELEARGQISGHDYDKKKNELIKTLR